MACWLGGGDALEGGGALEGWASSSDGAPRQRIRTWHGIGDSGGRRRLHMARSQAAQTDGATVEMRFLKPRRLRALSELAQSQVHIYVYESVVGIGGIDLSS